MLFNAPAADGPDYSPSPGNYRFSDSSVRSCLEILVRADTFYEDTETLSGNLVALVDENGATVNSIRGVILSPDNTDIFITDVDGMSIVVKDFHRYILLTVTV